MQVFEGMYGTSRSSYSTLEGKAGRTRMIVRHTQKVDETKVVARSRFVESIMIENQLGERMLFPTNGLAPARAMTQHVNMGGGFPITSGSKSPVWQKTMRILVNVLRMCPIISAHFRKVLVLSAKPAAPRFAR